MSNMPPDKHILHKMGYYSNQEGIALRYIREDDNWNNHLSNTRRFIINAVKKVKPDTVTVLGSGWLLDIPVNEILNYASQIRLIDLVHPPDLVRSFAGNSSVILVNEDVTGGLPALAWDIAGEKHTNGAETIIEKVRLLRYEPDSDPGMVLSVNLLSQLATLPFEFLQKKKLIDDSDYSLFVAAVQEAHLGFLKKHSSVVITDWTEIQTARNGRVEREQIVKCRLPEGSRREEWTWQFDSTGTYKQGYTTEMQVVAISI
jgi:hypothetical protein